MNRSISDHKGYPIELSANSTTDNHTSATARVLPPDQVPTDAPSADIQLDRICGVVAHELRNPLSVFKTAVDLMEADSHADPQLRGILKLQTERMTHLVDDLLDMSRCVNGKMRLRKRPTPLHTIVDWAAQSIRSILAEKLQSVVMNNTAHGVWIDGDPFRLTQVLVNLLSNASKFSDRGMQIRLDISAGNDCVELSISDDGIGITANDLPHVFDFFAQAQTACSLDHSAGGMGIGLGLVKRLVDLHDGCVTAHSDGKDHGSTFVVRLPICAPADTSAENKPHAALAGCYRVLIVDDRRENEWLLKSLITELGSHETRSATDGRSALECLREFQPDLILLDLSLPGMSGLELACEIRRLDHCRNTFIVALTGYDNQEMRKQAEAAGIDLYRLKPISTAILNDIFERLSNKSAGDSMRCFCARNLLHCRCIRNRKA
jgi:CheY-like chemotaxis protein/two-component sensor histidine kinase